MTNTLKRHVYLYCTLSIISFLGAFLLYSLLDIGIFTDRLFFPCAVLWITGAILALKAGDVWSDWDSDTSEDTNARQPRGNPYPITFSIAAITMMILVVCLFIFTLIRNQPTANESCVLIFGLIIAEGCICLNHLSSHLE